jgi:hypothetical protein
MELLAPEVKGPISACSKQVRVRGHIAGAEIIVRVNGEDAAPKLSHLSDDYIDLDAPLAADDRVTAWQRYGGMESPPSPVAAVVQKVPQSLSALTIATQLHECGTAVWADGAVPGAEITARIDGTVVGSGHSVDGTARLNYTPGLGPGQSLTLEQTTCNGLTNTTVSPVALSLPDPLPVPMIHGPLMECMTAFRISGIVDGATVSIFRDGEEASSVAFDRSSLTFRGLAPLKKDELIEVRQSFTCRSPRDGFRDRFRPPFGRRRRTSGDTTRTSEPASTTVQAVGNLPKPVILGSICPQPYMITITNLLPSARVILYVDGEPVAMSDAPAKTASFGHAALAPGSKVTARLQLCDHDGPMSDPVEVTGDEPTGGFTVSRLYECAPSIFIRDDSRETFGKIVFARDQHGNVISAHHQVHQTMYHLPVSPALSAGDQITIVVRRCGGVTDEFGPYEVHPLPHPLPGPVIHEPVCAADPAVWVKSQHAGALLRVLVDGVVRGQAISRGDQFYTPIPVSMTLPFLTVGQEVIVVKTMCAMMSRSSPVTVVPPKPMPPQLITPDNHATGVPATPTTFTWSDPGASMVSAAESFEIRVLWNGTFVAGQHQSGTQYAVSLPHNATFTWSVIAKNVTDTTESATFTFRTEAGDGPEPEPPPQPPPGNALLGITLGPFAGYDKHTIQNHPNAHQRLYLIVYVANGGTGTSEEFKLLLELDGASAGGYSYVILDGPALPPGGVHHFAYELPNGLPPGEWFAYAQVYVNNTAVTPKAYNIILVGF